MAPSGEKHHMIAEIWKMALNWGDRVCLGKASPADSLVALHTLIAIKLKYPLAALTLTEKKCNHIMAPAIRAALCKAGFSGSMLSVFWVTISSMGLNVAKLTYSLQWALPRHFSWCITVGKHQRDSSCIIVLKIRC